MEEDIKILEKLSKTEYYGDEIFKKESQAIENILTDYKQKLHALDKNENFIKELGKEIDRLREENEKLTTNYNLLEESYFTDNIPKAKVKEIVDECIPRGKNIITGVEEYQPNANANSYLTQMILELLKDGGE